MKHYITLITLFIISLVFISCRQTKTIENKTIAYQGPKTITRNIIQDREGNIWLAAFDGVFKYDGKSFRNIMMLIRNQARFFSILEDRKGVFWFGTIGSGVYRYDGKVFQNFTTKNGLLNDEVGSIYKDRKGNIWFGVSGGASCYDGQSFKNYIIEDNTMKVDLTGKSFADRQPYEVNSMIEDNNGNFWFASRGNTFIFDGKDFSVLSHKDKTFKNIRTLIKDKKGSIWFSGDDGLWKYNDGVYTNYHKQFVGYIMEDKAGNIWTSSEKEGRNGWTLSKYDGKTLANANPTVTVMAEKQMIFGILEAKDGIIWFGHLDGVSRYDGKSVKDFFEKESKM